MHRQPVHRSTLALLGRRAFFISAIALAAGCAQTPQQNAQDGDTAEPVRVMTSGGFAEAHQRLAPEFSKANGIMVETVLGSSMGSSPTSIPNRLEKGEIADVVILARTSLDQLAAQGYVKQGTQIDLVRSAIGVSVKKGAPVPDISTEEKFKHVLLNAKSIAYSASASGTYFEAEMLKKLGIHDQVMPKSRKIVTERVGTIVARGEAEIGLQQVSELLPIQGTTFVGKIPESVQQYTFFSAGVARTSTNPQGMASLLKYYTSLEARKTIEETGLEPVATPR
ncbi:ABC transporter substrate-binding protein [Diaphorobacter sp. HDW4A]|uniref:substrate-binding domain-containing protein n=1 Tax=Diaphorobacter sp. HDW4A TaxID=2714924 RepID=UPI00140DB842|nr:substrate-binding domain-containing protein [Diaphorobacter sp. HDW4A]QIL82068.1 ABC transporter substrate-binding protein [Diaphorobacter sp. HDW4A]